MKDFGNSDGRPHREDTDGSQEGQPAYKAFAKDKRTRITTSRPVEKVDYRREGHEPAERPVTTESTGVRRSTGAAAVMPVRGVTAGKAVMTATATERRAATVRASGRHTSSEAKVVALTVPVTAGTVTILGLIRPTVVRRDRPAKGQRGANPTIPISMSTTGRLAGTVTTPPAIRRGASAGAADTADRKAVSREGSRYGNDRSQEGRPERYAPRYGHGEGERGEGKEPREYAGGRPYGRSEGGERRYGDGKRPYGERGTGDRKGYGSKPYGTQGGGAYGGRPTDRRRPAGQRGPKVPKYNSENYPTFPAPVIEDKIRLNRYIAMSGICSRREADEFIQSGVVSVNGLVVTELGAKVSQQDEVRFNGNVIRNERKVYIVMNKPKGYVTSVEDPHADKTVMELLKEGCRERVYPVGRLDKNSLGVLLITNDGDMAKKLMHPSFEKKKVYQVSLDKPLTHADMDALVQGFELDDGEIHADAVSYVGTKKTEIGIEIHSGRNRIVRRMFEHLGYKVTKLDRVYFAGLTKQRLKRGEWRFLTPREVQALRSGQYE